MAAPNIKIEGHVECTIFPRGGRNCVSVDGVLYELVDYLPDPENRTNRFRLAKMPKGYYSVSYHEPEKVCKSTDDAVLTSHSVEQVAAKFVRAQTSLVDLARKYNIPVEEMNPNLELLQGMLDEAVGGLHASHARTNAASHRADSSSGGGSASSSSSKAYFSSTGGKGSSAATDHKKEGSSASASSLSSNSQNPIAHWGHPKDEEEGSRAQSLLEDWLSRGWLEPNFLRPYLHSAAFSGSFAAIGHLSLENISFGSVGPYDLDCFHPWDDTSTPMHCVAAGGCPGAFNYMITRDKEALKALTHRQKFPVSFAAAFGGANMLRLLFDATKKLDNPTDNAYGLGIAHFAAIGGDIQALSFLTSQGFQVNGTDRMELIPLHYAAARNHVGLVKWCLERDVKIPKNSKLSLLHAASLSYSSVVVEYLEKRVDFKATDSFGANAAHYAASAGSLQVLEFLHSKGVNFRLAAHGGFTPYHLLLLAEPKLEPDMVAECKDFFKLHSCHNTDLPAVRQAPITTWFAKLQPLHGHTVKDRVRLFE